MRSTPLLSRRISLTNTGRNVLALRCTSHPFLTAVVLLLLSSCAATCRGPITLPSVIAFQSDRTGNNQIYTMHADGSDLTRVTNDASDDQQPIVSALGLKIGYVSAPAGSKQYDLWTVFGNGSSPERLTQTLNARGGHWSPLGVDIAFSGTNAAGDGPDIYLIRNDGTHLRRLTSGAGSNIEPCFSPDGKKIVFTSTMTGISNIYLMNADGTQLVQLTDLKSNNAEATFSPDGKQIAFWSNRSGNGELYLMNADGSNQRNLTNGPGFDFEPAYSPNTPEVVFSSQRDGPNFQIYVINVETKVVRRLTNDTSTDRAPDWH